MKNSLYPSPSSLLHIPNNMKEKIIRVLCDIDDIPTPWLGWAFVGALVIAMIKIFSHS